MVIGRGEPTLPPSGDLNGVNLYAKIWVGAMIAPHTPTVPTALLFTSVSTLIGPKSNENVWTLYP